MTQLLPPKKEVALALLEKSNVDVYLDPRAEGVVVPPQFRKEPRLILKIGLNMPVPIPDLRLDDDSMSCTLSFNRARFFCVVPWSSVFAMVGDDGRGMVWPDDVPQELAVKVVEDRNPTLSRPGDVPAAPAARGTAASRASKSRIQPDSPSAGESGRKKSAKKKKEDAQRPLLVALPAPPSSRPELRTAQTQLADKRSASADAKDKPKLERVSASQLDKSEPAAPVTGIVKDGVVKEDARPAEPPATPRIAGPASPTRPKRELPPYLRVVK